MTTRVPGRHRAPVRPRTPLTDLSDGISRTANGAVRTGAVAVAAGGLVVSVAIPASAATSAAPAAFPAVSSSLASAVPAAFGTTAAGVVSAPDTASTAVATTATFSAAPEAAPVVVAPVITRSLRVADASPVVTASAAAESEVAEPAAAAASSDLGARILDVAADYAGVPYVYGGTTPSGFDCSGYTSYVMRQVGVSIPRTSNAQLQASTRISRGAAVPGDFVFFTNSSGSAYHVGIYAGDGMMWDAPRTGKPVQLRAIWSDSVSFGRIAPVA